MLVTSYLNIVVLAPDISRDIEGNKLQELRDG